MRLNNELIVFDLEATSNQEDADSRPALQTNNFITEITSITPGMCEGQPLWKDIGPEFEAWISRHC